MSVIWANRSSPKHWLYLDISREDIVRMKLVHPFNGQVVQELRTIRVVGVPTRLMERWVVLKKAVDV